MFPDCGRHRHFYSAQYSIHAMTLFSFGPGLKDFYVIFSVLRFFLLDFSLPAVYGIENLATERTTEWTTGSILLNRA